MAAVARLTRDLSQERASVLAKEAVELSAAGNVEVRGIQPLCVYFTCHCRFDCWRQTTRDLITPQIYAWSIPISESCLDISCQEATRKLRAAAALSHNNADVQTAFLKLHDGQNDSPLLALCRRYAVYHDAKAGDEAAEYLKGAGPPVSSPIALGCLKLLLKS